MAEIYFARHGETFWNVENKICGATDIGLTEKGHQQAEELGHYVLEKMNAGEIKIDEIISSPLIRAHDTAKHVSDITGIPMRDEPMLTEQCFGIYEARPRDSHEFWEAKQHFADSFGNGESMLKIAHRIYSLLDKLKEESLTTGKSYLLVAHNGISRVVNSYFYDMTNEDYSSFGIRNCDILKYEFK